MKSIFERADLNKLKNIIFDNQNDPELLELEVHNLYYENDDNTYNGQDPKPLIDDPFSAVCAYIGNDYLDDYDVIGTCIELGCNDEYGNVVLKDECRTADGHLSDYFANIVDAHHIEDEYYYLTTHSGHPVYSGTDRRVLVFAFISYMDEVYDTEAGDIDYDDMLEMLDDFETPLRLVVTQTLASRPNVRRYHGYR